MKDFMEQEKTVQKIRSSISTDGIAELRLALKGLFAPPSIRARASAECVISFADLWGAGRGPGFLEANERISIWIRARLSQHAFHALKLEIKLRQENFLDFEKLGSPLLPSKTETRAGRKGTGCAGHTRSQSGQHGNSCP